MPLYLKLALFPCAIILPFAIGAAYRTRMRQTRELSRSLVRVNIIFLEPLIILWCAWELNVTSGLILLPLFGLGLVAAGVVAGSLSATMLRIRGPRRKTFLICSSLANHGFTMGGTLCYFFYGEPGLGYSVILVLYFIPYVYCLVFPYAKSGSGTLVPRGALKSLVFSLQNMPLYAMAAGVLANIAGIRRPDFMIPVDVLLLLSVSLYYFTLGMTFSGFNFRGTLREIAALCSIKFIVVPGATFVVLSASFWM